MTASFPWHRECPYRPPARYALLRAERPIAKVTLATGRPAWVVTRYDHARALLGDPRAGSDRAHEGFPYYLPVPPQFRTEASFIGDDPPVHTALRRIAAGAGDFTRARARALRPRIQQIVDEHVDAMLAAGGPLDLMAALALPVPLTVVCELLGVPSADHRYLLDRTDVLFGGRSGAAERATAITEVNAYLGELVDAAVARPGEDLLSRIIAGHRAAGPPDQTDPAARLDRRAVVNMLRLLLNGGHETSAAMIALGVLTLLEHPDQLAMLRREPALLPGAVEELLRYLSPGDLATSRVALADIELGGVTIRAGDGIVILGLAANRDPDAFPDPDVLDLRRAPRRHLAFGYGVHHCIGAELARAELVVVLGTLLRRLPGLRLARPWPELRFKDGGVMYGVYELPVTF